MDGDGLPVGYVATRKDPSLGTVEYDVTARDNLGRTRVIHVFDGMPGQVRGISPLTPALQVARHRTTFGRTLIDHPMARRQLLKLMLPTEQALTATTRAFKSITF